LSKTDIHTKPLGVPYTETGVPPF